MNFDNSIQKKFNKRPFLGSTKWPHFDNFGNIYCFYEVTLIFLVSYSHLLMILHWIVIQAPSQSVLVLKSWVGLLPWKKIRSKIWGAKSRVQKLGHCYSKREEAAWPLLFFNNNNPVFFTLLFRPHILDLIVSKFQTLKKYQVDLTY